MQGAYASSGNRHPLRLGLIESTATIAATLDRLPQEKVVHYHCGLGFSRNPKAI